MLLKLAYYGDPILRKKAEPVKEISETIRTLAQDMVDTMIAHNGIGLAGPQVHQSLRIFVMSIPIQQPDESWKHNDPLVFINPEILSFSEDLCVHSEGCLSIPKIYGDVLRPCRITIRCLNVDGEMVTRDLSELQARCALHENDHLNGVLFIDRMRGKERKDLDPLLKNVKNKFYKN